MLKLPTIIALFVCFVYSNNEHNVETQVPSSELHSFNKHNEDNKNTFQTFKGHYVEEKQSTKPCKENKNRRLDSKDNENPDLFESLPITATLEQVNTATIGDKIITSSLHGANYNFKNENTDTEIDKNDLQNNCDCDNCVLEANKKVLQFESMELGGNSPFSTTPSDIKTAELADSADNDNTPFIEVLLDKSVTDYINDVPPVSVPLDINFGESVPLNMNTDENFPLHTNAGEKVPLNINTGKNGPLNTNAGESVPLNVDTGENGPLDNNAGDSVPLNITTGESISLKNNTDDHKTPCHKGLNINTRRRKCGKIILPENSPTKTTSRRILPGIINNPTDQELEDNKLFQDGPKLTIDQMGIQKKYKNLALPVKISNSTNYDSEDQLLYQDSPQPDIRLNDETDAETRHSYFPNVNKVSNSYDIDMVHNMNVNQGPQQELPQESAVENQLLEPTKGKGIYDMKETGVMLLENARVCYACSSLSDPTCWTPDRRTTVKYCRKGHESCLTKTLKHKGKAIIIRDCGSYCVNLPSGDKNYNSCSICHTDLCNGAASINIYTGIGIIVFFGILFNTRQEL